MREAVLTHSGEAEDSRVAFQNLPEQERDAVIEFLKSLQVRTSEMDATSAAGAAAQQ